MAVEIRAIVIYTDNDGVRDCLISCNTSSCNAKLILDLFLKVEFEASFNALDVQGSYEFEHR